MDKFEISILIVGAVIIAALVSLAIVFVPLDVRERNAKINLYNAAAEGKATGVIIRIGIEE